MNCISEAIVLYNPTTIIQVQRASEQLSLAGSLCPSCCSLNLPSTIFGPLHLLLSLHPLSTTCVCYNVASIEMLSLTILHKNHTLSRSLFLPCPALFFFIAFLPLAYYTFLQLSFVLLQIQRHAYMFRITRAQQGTWHIRLGVVIQEQR